MQTPQEKASYCIGLEAGRNLKKQFTELDSELIASGFQDAVRGYKPRLAEEEVATILHALQREMANQQRAHIEKIAESNKKQGESFLERNKGKPGVQTLSSGLQYEVIRQGEGTPPSSYDTVKVHYKGTSIDGREFDSTYHGNKEPRVFPVGQLIPGWTEALKMMKPGAKYILYIPHYLAYGEQGYPPHIEPNLTLIFEMELLEVNPNAQQQPR